MDERTAIEKKGIAPLNPTMEAIAAIQTKQGLKRLGCLHRNGVSAIFSFSQMPDMHDSRPPDHRQHRSGWVDTA